MAMAVTALMAAALKRAKLEVDEIDYINAHGTSTPLGDVIEANAVRRLLGSDNSNISMSSTKSATGHLLGAAGAIEAIFSTLAVDQDIVPPTLNLHDPEPALDGLDLVPLRRKSVKCEMLCQILWIWRNKRLPDYRQA